MFFKDIDGKDSVKKELIRVVSNGRIPHAQIFLGNEGSGALGMALAFASYIQCTNPSEFDSCGECNHCIKSHKLIHPDIHFSFPVVTLSSKKRADTTSTDFLPKWRQILLEKPFMNTSDWLLHIKAESSLPNINVKECNEILHKLSMMSYEAESKVLIMWLPEYLHSEGNRLLKLIEEPTNNTYIILVAENQDQILKTILSRCQLVKIPPFENDQISRYLSTKLSIPAVMADQYANLAEGNINIGIDLARSESADYSEFFISWLRTAFKADPILINEWIQNITSLNKDGQMHFFEYGLHFLRQFVLFKVSNIENITLTEDEQKIVASMEPFISFDAAEQIIALLNESIENIHRNINLKIMLFADTLTIHSLFKKQAS